MKSLKLIDQLLTAGVSLSSIVIVPERNCNSYFDYFGMCNLEGIRNIVKRGNMVKAGIYVYDKELEKCMSEENYNHLTVNEATDGFTVQYGNMLPEFIHFFKYEG